MIPPRVLLVAAALVLVSASARAEVREAAADGFFVALSESVAVPPAKIYAGIVALPAWWDSEHTFSGKAANLSLKAEAGGCFCEKWGDGSVEHGRVVMALPGKLLRIEAALGPLQELALKGELSFWIRTGEDGATTLDVEYRVNGASTSKLDELAPEVDDMLATQVARLKRYIETGNAEPPVAPPAAALADPNANGIVLKPRAAPVKGKSKGRTKTPSPASKPASDPGS